jgi:DNA invertase Pin-like site-specific DNA recombinase
VSTKDQNEDRQVEALRDKVEKLYIDKATGVNVDRPGLQDMLSFIREGDMVYFESISRLARNTKDFLQIMDLFQSRKVDVGCLKEPIDTCTPAGKMVMTVFAAMYEMEWANIRQRQREGINIALAKGVRFGRPRVEPPNFEKVYQRWRTGKISAAQAMRELDIKRSSFYRRVREIEHGRKEESDCQDKT